MTNVIRILAEDLLELANRVGAMKFAKATALSSGGHSDYYFDARLLTLDLHGAWLAGQAAMALIRNVGAISVGGPATSALPIVMSVMHSGWGGNVVSGFYTRIEPKPWGMGKTIEGPTPYTKVVIVDDTCTSGRSLLNCIEAVEAIGCEVVKVVVILDRQEGGSDLIRGRGYDFQSILTVKPPGVLEVTGKAL